MKILIPVEIIKKLDWLTPAKKDKCLWFVYNLLKRKHRKKHDLEDYTGLNSEVLEKHIKKYTSIRDILISAKIISTPRSYCPGSSIGYAIHLDEIELVSYQIHTKTLLPKITDSQTSQNILISGCLAALRSIMVDQYAYKYLNASESLNDADYIFHSNTIFQLESGQHYCNRDQEGRLYHNVVNLPKDMRRFLIGKSGQRFIYEVDVSSEIPFILGYLMQQSGKYLTIDMNKFITMSRTDSFYRQLSVSIKSKNDAFKKSFLVYLNEKTSKNERKIEYQKLKGFYPGVFSFIEEMKISDHTSLYRNCIAIESKIMIDIAYKKILEMNIECLPIHDGMLTIESEVDAIRNIVYNSWVNEIGISPSIKIKTQS